MRQTSIRPYVSEVYQVRRSDGTVNIELPQPILIVGDVKIEFQHKIKMDILNLAQKYVMLNESMIVLNILNISGRATYRKTSCFTSGSTHSSSTSRSPVSTVIVPLPVPVLLRSHVAPGHTIPVVTQVEQVVTMVRMTLLCLLLAS